MVADRDKGALWSANASLLMSLAVGVMNHEPSAVEHPNRMVGDWDFRGGSLSLVKSETEQNQQSVWGGTIILTTSYHQQSRENPLAVFHGCDVTYGMADLQENRNVHQECLETG